MPDTPELQAAFGQPGGQKPGCGFPVAHLLAQFHAGTGMLRKMIEAPLRTHDMAGIQATHSHMEVNDVMLGDRAFCSYVHLALLFQAGMHGVFRVHQRIVVDFRIGRMHAPPFGPYSKLRGLPKSRWIKWQGHLDQLVEYFKPKQKPEWMTTEEFEALPASLVVRELRYQIKEAGYRTREITLVTTLLDPERYPAEELAQLYADRWQVETNLRHLKQTLSMDVLRCKTVEGVQKELRMFALVYNLVRLVMLRSAELQNVRPDRISFVDALRWLSQSGNGRTIAELRIVPRRPHRIEPRVIKRRMKEYDLMTKPRAVLRQALLAKRHAA